MYNSKYCIARFILTAMLLTITCCDIYSLWSSEHLDDLIMSDAYRNSIPATTPAIIALYSSECEHLLYQTGFTDRSLPPPTQLLIAKYDRIKAQTETWYNFDESHWDLFHRYNISIEPPTSNWCPTIIYQPAKWSDPVIIYDPKSDHDGTFIDWAWNMLTINVTFTNNLQNTVYLSLELQDNVNDIRNLGTEPIIAEIAASESVTIPLHVADIIVVWNPQHQVVNRLSINAVDDEINIDEINQNENILNGINFTKN